MRYSKLIKLATVGAATIFLMACSATRSVPFTVQSDPLGAQVMMQLKSESNTQSDWVYLGNTPLTTQRKISTKHMDKDHSFVVMVMKEGYSNQTREWSGSQVKQASKGDNRIFWNPKMIDQAQ